jgi:PTH1 family peptidyl-tRNA hydrolase
MPAEMYLIVGLGNPGRAYRNNRHSVGFMLIDRIATEVEASRPRVQAGALVAAATLEGRKLILAKPQTYMNLSGPSVQGLLNFYKLPLERLLVAHDDLDIPFGVLRLRPGGGPGGQKGMASAIDYLGTRQFARLRIGIGRPPGRMDPAAFVLQDFPPDERDALDEVLGRAVQAALTFMRVGIDRAMNQFNTDVLKDDPGRFSR